MRRGSVSISPTEQQCQKFSLAQIKSATQNFEEGLVVGEGGFGKVYKGFIKNREEVVAVKRLRLDQNKGRMNFGWKLRHFQGCGIFIWFL
ncbi:hypothetical protein LIER_31475 [Lithospermum erythrorhizon]|uniref:Uncharacterized protein n=1 Tax=Lithospermum erythrorhizon TaxID=34254 RepID=A0AAV3RV35_LITER